jgi:hypothetical protein
MEGLAGIAISLVAVAALMLAAIALLLVVRPSRQAGAWPTPGARTAELERRVTQLAHRLEVVEADVDAQQGSDGPARPASATLRTAGVAISHLGLVRFDAFDDAGGAQSFALALLDDDADGIVLTSLHSRQTTRLYVKGVRRGVADSPLSGEEVRAMQQAGIDPSV